MNRRSSSLRFSLAGHICPTGFLVSILPYGCIAEGIEENRERKLTKQKNRWPRILTR